MAGDSSIDNAREFTAETSHKGWRLDHFLSRALPELSRARLQALIKNGNVTHSGLTIGDPNYRVKPGESYAVKVPPPTAANPVAQEIPLSIVHEDDDLIVIDKPAGLVVHPAAGNVDGTLVNALLAHCGASLPGIGGVARPGIVHRLDKDTSGLIVVAKNERAMRSLGKQFARTRWGAPTTPSSGDARAHRTHRGNRSQPLRSQTHGGAATRANPRARAMKCWIFSARDSAFASLISAGETGRTHQIRVHLAHLGHPLIGDATYGRSRHAPRRKRRGADCPPGGGVSAAGTSRGRARFFHPSRQVKLRWVPLRHFANLMKALRGLNAGVM
jgi:23S rRNA pseudouridine1911/1915/1917 synthase